LQINRQNLKWISRLMLILLLVGAADILVVLFVRRPLSWVAVIGTLLPLLTCVLVILPLARAEKPAPPSA
jgi:hypothetical protein